MGEHAFEIQNHCKTIEKRLVDFVKLMNVVFEKEIYVRLPTIMEINLHEVVQILSLQLDKNHLKIDLLSLN